MTIIIVTRTETPTTPTTSTTPITPTDGHLIMAGQIYIVGAMGHAITRVKIVFTRITGTRIMQPWRTRFPVPQGFILAAEMEGQRY